MHKLVGTLAALAMLGGCGSSDVTTDKKDGAHSQTQAETKSPASLNGTWKADGFDAVIADNSIEIHLVSEDTRSLYWKGTFPAGAKSVTSVADTEALSGSILGSQDAQKVFTVKDEQIDFEMSMLGTTKKVRLRK